jgi:hypothetical protein
MGMWNGEKKIFGKNLVGIMECYIFVEKLKGGI